MVTDEKPQILNCNIQFYFKSIEQTVTFELCFISQFKCNGLHDSFEIELNITIYCYLSTLLILRTKSLGYNKILLQYHIQV